MSLTISPYCSQINLLMDIKIRREDNPFLLQQRADENVIIPDRVLSLTALCAKNVFQDDALLIQARDNPALEHCLPRNATTMNDWIKAKKNFNIQSSSEEVVDLDTLYKTLIDACSSQELITLIRDYEAHITGLHAAENLMQGTLNTVLDKLDKFFNHPVVIKTIEIIVSLVIAILLFKFLLLTKALVIQSIPSITTIFSGNSFVSALADAVTYLIEHPFKAYFLTLGIDGIASLVGSNTIIGRIIGVIATVIGFPFDVYFLPVLVGGSIGMLVTKTSGKLLAGGNTIFGTWLANRKLENMRVQWLQEAANQA